MERKRIIEIVLALILLLGLIGLLLWLFLFSPQAKVETTETDNTQTLPTNEDQPTTSTDTTTPATVSSTPKVTAPATVARTFVERLGSYSSESNYENIHDVLSLVTDQLGAELERNAEDSRKSEESLEGGYYGISTTVMSTKTVSQTDTEMTLRIQTQRNEARGNPGNAEVRYQEIVLVLVKADTTWKVAQYRWE